MRCGVDAAGKPGGHGEARPAEHRRDLHGEARSGDGGVPRTDDGHDWTIETGHAAADGDERRCAVDHPEPGGIARLAEGNEPRADLLRGGEFRPRVVGGRHPDRAAAAAGKVGQRVEGHGRIAVARQQIVEGDGSDVVAADEAKPGDALIVGQPADRRHFLSPMRGSVPASRRRMLPSWR